MKHTYPWHRIVVFLGIVVCGLGLDLWSKAAVFSSLGGRDQRSEWTKVWLGGNVEFALWTSINEGALWGVGQGYSRLFAVISIIAAIVVIHWLFRRGAARSLWLTVCLGFVFAGTLGNLYDRLGIHGLKNDKGAVLYAVRDFLHFRLFYSPGRYYDWPTFNIADVCLVTGAIMLMLYAFFGETSLLDRRVPAEGTAPSAAS